MFLGDSITESWRGTDHCLPCNPRGRTGCDGHAAIFESAWGHYGAAAMGIGGDQVAHLMWRMKNGALPRRNQVQRGVEVPGRGAWPGCPAGSR